MRVPLLSLLFVADCARVAAFTHGLYYRAPGLAKADDDGADILATRKRLRGARRRPRRPATVNFPPSTPKEEEEAAAAAAAAAAGLEFQDKEKKAALTGLRRAILFSRSDVSIRSSAWWSPDQDDAHDVVPRATRTTPRQRKKAAADHDDDDDNGTGTTTLYKSSFPFSFSFSSPEDGDSGGGGGVYNALFCGVAALAMGFFSVASTYIYRRRGLRLRAAAATAIKLMRSPPREYERTMIV
jgi:hypothetical protein